MAYETPPTIAPNVTEAIGKLITAIGTNYDTIVDKLLTGCLNSSGIGVFIGNNTNVVGQALGNTLLATKETISQFINNQVIPITQKYDSAWANHPTDPRGITMKGVSIEMFRSKFNSILVDTNIAEVVTAVAAVTAVLPKWRSDNTQCQQYLYQLLTDQKASALWIWSYLTSATERWPAAVMSIDAYLGYLFFEFCWTTGAGVYSNGEIDSVIKNYGWTGKMNEWITFLIAKSADTPKMTMDILVKRAAYINNKGKNNPDYLKGWMDRFLNNPGSNLDYLVVVNENFNLNKKSLYTFSDSLKVRLEQKAAIYKTLKINV
jgi:hypothetical protein